MGISIAQSSNKIENLAVNEICEQLNSPNAKLIMFFASSRYALGRLNKYFTQKFPEATVVGCTTAGEIISGAMLKKSIVAMSFDESIIENAKGEFVNNLSEGINVEPAFESFHNHFKVNPFEMDIDKYIGIILVDGLRMKEENLMDEIGNNTNITFIGGSAGDDLNFKQTNVSLNGKELTDSAVLLLLKPAVPFSTIKTQSFEKLDKTFKATKVNEEQREVIEFNGKPALEEYAQSLGTTIDKAEDYFMTNPVGLVIGDDPKSVYVRSPQRTSNKNIVFYCNILKDMDVELLKSGDICSETKNEIKNKEEEFGDIAGIINFHCILRTLELERLGQCEKYAGIFKDIPTIGFSTYGEEYIGHINQTSTMIVFKDVKSKDETLKVSSSKNESFELAESEPKNIKIIEGGSKSMSTNFYMPRVNLMGMGCHRELGAEISKLGYKKAFVATNPGMIKRGSVEKILKVLEKINVEFVIWEGIIPNPTVASVEEGLNKLNEAGNCDFILSVGGGSYHDASKAIAILASNGGKIQDYEGANKLTENSFPHVAVNTTSGTASQITRFSVITDEERKIKMVIVDDRTTPAVSVDDPELMMTMSSSLTASTGMDALTHAVEAYVSTSATVLTDTLALKAIELIGKYLRRSVWNPNDVEAKDMMTWAEHIAGMAFNNGLLGYVHAIAHQLGGYYNLAHGVCNALLLPYICEFNSKAVPDRFKEVAKALGEFVDEDSDTVAAVKAVKAIRKLSSDIQIPKTLKELGVKEQDIPVLAKNALNDVCGLANPRRANIEDIIKILQKAY
ncbi:MAG: iron-containing alcohol dehydrogenase [Clostridiales bacterium]